MGPSCVPLSVLILWGHSCHSSYLQGIFGILHMVLISGEKMLMMFCKKAEERGRDSWVQRNVWPHLPTEGWHAVLRITAIRWAKSYPLGRSFILHVRYRTGRTVTSITWIFLKDANVALFMCVFCFVEWSHSVALILLSSPSLVFWQDLF